MDIQEEINSELLRLGVPVTSLGAFQLDASQEPEVVRVHCEGVTFDPQDFLSSFQRLPVTPVNSGHRGSFYVA